MSLPRGDVELLIRDLDGTTRFTQDSPVLPDVWIGYAGEPDEPMELLLTPHTESTTGALLAAVRQSLERERASDRWARLKRPLPRPSPIFNDFYVLTGCYFDELIRAILPLSGWWRDYLWAPRKKHGEMASAHLLGLRDAVADPGKKEILLGQLVSTREFRGMERFSDRVVQFVRVAGAIRLSAREESLLGAPEREGRSRLPEGWQRDRQLWADVLDAFLEMTADIGSPPGDAESTPPLWSVNRNRKATRAVWRSRLAVKADAAVRLFNITCKGLRWAVIDSGVDATHPAFTKEPEKPVPPGKAASRSRVFRTYDFTRLRLLLDPREENPGGASGLDALPPDKRRELQEDLQRDLKTGKAVNWNLLEPYLRVPQDRDEAYVPPVYPHGTHVAGTLAGNWIPDDPAAVPEEERLIGICPDLELYDLRVLDQDGLGEEFSVIAALQFVRFLNDHSHERMIHGVNLSLALNHDAANFACGRTPVCEECERLVGNGVVVVAAAGNRGYVRYLTAEGPEDDYRSISITDPGNAANVITVGATHRYHPHTYGVSYFSSRGPTGDGRVKPDLVAPGEKIKAPVPNRDAISMDGTSMAAPHVSGAAALLMARHRELVGRPREVKEILCRTATDLGRERYFQGCGMLDVLRALQSV